MSALTHQKHAPPEKKPLPGKNECVFRRTHVVDAPRGDGRMWWRARHADGTAGLGAGGLPQPNRQNDRALSGRRHHRLSGRLDPDGLKTGLGATVILDKKPGTRTTLGAGHGA